MLVVESCLSAVFMCDAIFRVGEQRNSQQDGQITLKPGSWMTMSEHFQECLPRLVVRPIAPVSASLQAALDHDPSIEAQSNWWTDWGAYLDNFRVAFAKFPLS